MNINITPSAVAVDTAANLLTFIELARDPSKLKAVIDQIKDAQDAAAAEVAAAAEAKAEMQDAVEEMAQSKAQIEKDAAAVASANADIARRIEEANAIAESAKAERVKFDNWMAAEREALANAKASVEAAADQVARRAAALSKAESEIADRFAAADAAMAAANAKGEEFEAKLAGLKAMVS